MRLEVVHLQDKYFADAEALFKEYPHVFNKDDNKNLRQEFLKFLEGNLPFTFVYVARMDDHIVGAVMFHKDQSSSNEYWEIDWLVVQGNMHNQGVGTALIQKTEEEVRKHHGEHVYLKTSAGVSNESAIHFYKKHHFTQLVNIPQYYGAHENAFVLYKRVH